MMDWYVPVFLRGVVMQTIGPIFVKRIVDKQRRGRRFRAQYFQIAILVWGAIAVTGTPVDYTVFLPILGLGFLQSFGTYCSWRAINLSLSKTALVTQGDDLIGIGLGYLLLGELRYLHSSRLAFGVVLAIAAVLLYTLCGTRREATSEGRVADLRLVKWVIGYSVLWGFAYFALRVAALNDVSIATLVAAWYSGSFIGANVVYRLVPEKERGSSLSVKDQLQVVPLTLIVVLALMLQYWGSRMSPLTVHQPIYQITELVIPALLGLYYFKERNNLTVIGRVAFAIGAVAMLIIASSY